MKLLHLLGISSFLLFSHLAPQALHAQESAMISQILLQAQNLDKEGNFKDARLLLEKDEHLSRLSELNTNDTNRYLDLLFYSRQRDEQLGREQDEWIEKLLVKFPTDWRVYAKASSWILNSGSYGSIIDGKFKRNDYSGRQVSSGDRDRVQALIWAKKALDLFREQKAKAKNPQKDEAYLLDLLKYAVVDDNGPWELHLLTDLSVLPDYEDDGIRYRPRRGYGRQTVNQGYPVDDKGDPIFFAVPNSWEDAKSDGERWRWVINELSKVSEDVKMVAELEFAQQISSWLDVQTLANDPVWISYQRRFESDSDSDVQEAKYALGKLKDHETIAKFANGIKKIELPQDYQFLVRLKEIAKNDPSLRGTQALQILANAYQNRRQYTTALSVWKELHSRTSKKDKNSIERYQYQIDFIEKPLGKVDSLNHQVVGKSAQVELTFRNAEKVKFSARAIKVGALLQAVRRSIEEQAKNPKERKYENLDWWNAAFGQLLQMGSFHGKQLDAFLSADATRWEEALQPLEGYRDRRVTIQTPLTEAGVYLLEAQFENGNSTRCLVEIQDTVIITKPMSRKGVQDQKGYEIGILTDAVTGKPIPNADVTLFGVRSRYIPSRNRNVQQIETITRTVKTDTNGLFEVADYDSQYRWLYEARTFDGRVSYIGFNYLNSYHSGEHQNSQPKAFLFTDRPIYRPDQTVHIAGWAKLISYDEKVKSNAFTQQQAGVVITNSKGEEVLKGQYMTDQDGQISFSLPLPKNATLGRYDVSFNIQNRVYGYTQFRVEEYKKPEFEVQVDVPDKTIILGESFTIDVGAKYYFGSPVKNGTVTYKVERRTKTQSWMPPRPWDWLYKPGYWWRNSSYTWYSGHDRVAYCFPLWQPAPSDPPEVVAEGSLPLDEQGKAKLNIDTAFAKEIHGDKDHEYHVTAEVVDASRRVVTGSASIPVNRYPLDLYAWLDKGHYVAGDPANLTLQARNAQGEFVNGVAKIYIKAVHYRNHKLEEIEQAVLTADVTKKEPAKVHLQLPKAGLYRLQIDFEDEHGNKADTMVSTTVLGQGFDGSGYRLPDLELAADKEEYRVGDTAKILINTDQEGATIYIFERPRSGVYTAPVVKTLPQGKSWVHEMEIKSTDQPNAFIEVVTVHRGQVFQQVVHLAVPPAKQIAEVAMSTPKSTYEPRDRTELKIKVTDRENRPVKGRVIVSAYDKALDALAGNSQARDIKSFFWGFVYSHHVNSKTSLSNTYRHLPQKAPAWGPVGIFGGYLAGEPEGDLTDVRRQSMRSGIAPAAGLMMERGAVAAVASPAPASAPKDEASFKSDNNESGSVEAPIEVIRDNFADSILWNASIVCDERGEATLPIEFADDLTTWNLVAWTVGPNAEVGEAKIQVVTKKEIFIRPQAPRFFVEKDEVILSGIVHNDSTIEQDLKVSLVVDKHLKLQDGESFEVNLKLPAGGEKRVDWRVSAIAEGEAEVTMKVAAAQGGDAVRRTYPVLVHGIEKQLAWSQSISADKNEIKMGLEVPEERRPAQTTLTIQYSPSLALAMVESLPYLIQYPYGCVEQTLNRFVPAVQVQQVLKRLNLNLEEIAKHRANLNAQALGSTKLLSQSQLNNPVYDAKRLDEIVGRGLEKLQQAQNADGSWSWWPGAQAGDTYMTALVVEGLHRAKEAGANVDQNVVQQGLTWLHQYATKELQRLNLPEKDKNRKHFPDELDVCVHHIILQINPSLAPQAMRDRLYQHRLQFSRMTQARLGMIFGLSNELDRRDMVIRNLSQYLQKDDSNQTAWLSIENHGYWWRWYYDEIETMAAYLQLILQKDPKDPVAPQIVKYLLNNRAGGTYWKSTRDTASVVTAFADFVKATGEDQPDMLVEILLDGKVIKEAPINASNLFTGDHRMVLLGEAVSTGKHEIAIRRKGKGSLYVNAYLNYFSLEDPIKKAGAEVAVERRLYRLIKKDQLGTVSGSKGQVVKQREQTLERVLLQEMEEVKSGEEIEVELIVTSKNDYEYIMLEDAKAAGFEALEAQSGWTFDGGVSAYREFRDTHVNHYMTSLPKGTFTLRYKLRAEVPGKFSALPTRIEGMYSPELKGNSDEQKVKISD